MANFLPREKYRLLRERKKNFSLLSDWYGDERAENEITCYTCKPESLQDILSKVSSKIISADSGIFTEISAKWQDLAGNVIGKYSRPVSFQDKELVLGVRHSALLTELMPALELLKKRINARIPGAEVAEIKLEVI